MQLAMLSVPLWQLLGAAPPNAGVKTRQPSGILREEVTFAQCWPLIRGNL